ncbi:MAG: hypothetical protein ORN21_02500, partial [Methylophilaceae bacterium]|nr:hypothetical protein [Methylophilaceae bacterium]
ATQEARHINEIGEPPSSAQRRNSPVQTVLQRSQVMSLTITFSSCRKRRIHRSKCMVGRQAAWSWTGVHC